MGGVGCLSHNHGRGLANIIIFRRLLWIAEFVPQGGRPDGQSLCEVIQTVIIHITLFKTTAQSGRFVTVETYSKGPVQQRRTRRRNDAPLNCGHN
jgi:hypothetical protein